MNAHSIDVGVMQLNFIQRGPDKDLEYVWEIPGTLWVLEDYNFAGFGFGAFTCGVESYAHSSGVSDILEGMETYFKAELDRFASNDNPVVRIPTVWRYEGENKDFGDGAEWEEHVEFLGILRIEVFETMIEVVDPQIHREMFDQYRQDMGRSGWTSGYVGWIEAVVLAQRQRINQLEAVVSREVNGGPVALSEWIEVLRGTHE